MTEQSKSDLGRALQKPVKAGDVQAVKALLEAGADVNSDGGLALIWAAYKGNLEIVELLLEAGADRSLRDHDKTAMDWALEAGHTHIVTRLKENPDQIIFQQQLSDRTLEEIFNFVTLERISLIRKSPTGNVEAMACTGFSAIEDQSRLRRAFEEHRRRGGKTEESRVFPNVLSKPRIP